MTTININDNVKVEFDGLSYMPFIFRKGGDEYHDPRSGEYKLTLDKWVDCDIYFTTLKECLRYVAKQQTLNKQEYLSLKEYLDVFEDNLKTLLNDVVSC